MAAHGGSCCRGGSCGHSGCWCRSLFSSQQIKSTVSPLTRQIERPVPCVEAGFGWKAELNLGFKKKLDHTVLSSRTQSGPLTVQRPFYPEKEVCHLYLLHPPGGVVGGDELHINVGLEAGASVLLTTPGATKFYRSTGALAQQVQTLSVADGCALEWLPQENIFFDQTYSHLCTRILLEETARFIGWEINCYGRPASKDLFTNGQVRTRLEVVRNGMPLLLDQLLVEDTVALKSPGSFNGNSCFGTLIATPVSPRLLDMVRSIVSGRDNRQLVGLSLLDDLLVVRCLGHYSESIANTLRSIWAALRPELLEREACHPRIWLT